MKRSSALNENEDGKERVLFPAAKFTSRDLTSYYKSVSRFLLPHLKGHPVTLKRYPHGIHGEFFYEKDAPSFRPSWVKTFPVPRRDPTQPAIQYVLINDQRTLLWC